MPKALLPEASTFGWTLSCIPCGSTSTPSRRYRLSETWTPRLMFLTPAGTSKEKVCVGEVPRPLWPVSVPVKKPPFGPIGTKVRNAIGTWDWVTPPLEDGKRIATPLSPGCRGMLKRAVTHCVAPGARSKVAGDTEPAFT
jgi:hypothetical protein